MLVEVFGNHLYLSVEGALERRRQVDVDLWLGLRHDWRWRRHRYWRRSRLRLRLSRLLLDGLHHLLLFLKLFLESRYLRVFLRRVNYSWLNWRRFSRSHDACGGHHIV